MAFALNAAREPDGTALVLLKIAECFGPPESGVDYVAT
jgi:hypothetical protein